MESIVKSISKCAVKNNCLFCHYYKQADVQDSDFGASYGGKETCSEHKDCDEDGELDEAFDYESKKDCCDYEFWKVLDADERMQELFTKDMMADINMKQDDWKAYKYFLKKY
jgi:hypothetical protein